MWQGWNAITCLRSVSHKASDDSFNNSCGTGHQWIVLPAGLALDLKEAIATWRNQDQNENQTLTDGELVRLAKVVVESFLAKASGSTVVLPLNQIVTATCLKSTLRLNPTTVGGYCRFVCQMYEDKFLHLVDVFLTQWSAMVNSKELTIPSTFFDGICKCEALIKKNPDALVHGHVHVHKGKLNASAQPAA